MKNASGTTIQLQSKHPIQQCSKFSLKKKVGEMYVHEFPLLCYQTSLQHGDDLATLTTLVILVETCVNINPRRITNHSVVENIN
jgi:hypothetical protein